MVRLVHTKRNGIHVAKLRKEAYFCVKKEKQIIIMKRNILSITVLISSLLLCSCKYQANNKNVQKDVRLGDTYVYGVHPDSAARQSKINYTPNPDLEKRTNALRDKMFGAGSINEGN